VAPRPSVIERLVAAVLVVAERHVADQLTLTPTQVAALDTLLTPKDRTLLSVLGWVRQSRRPGPQSAESDPRTACNPAWDRPRSCQHRRCASRTSA
jgi:hypothetical protein